MSSVRSALILSASRVFCRPQVASTRNFAFAGLLRSSPCLTRVSHVNGRLAVPATTRYVHTAGDKELIEFLRDEIKLEKQNQKSVIGKLPKIKGFEIVGSEGPNVSFKKSHDNESITIKFNINNSVDEALSGVEGDNQPEQAQEQSSDAQMVSKPSFQVEINKGGKYTLAIQCIFPPADEYAPSDVQEETYEDLIEIQDVALLGKSQEWTDDVYSLSASVMDGNLYDMLMKMLEERGIDADFIDQLIEFSTSYEHARYVETLEKLKDFVDAK